MTVFTGRDPAVSDPADAATRLLSDVGDVRRDPGRSRPGVGAPVGPDRASLSPIGQDASAHPAAAHAASPADPVAEHRRPRRGCPGPRPARRGVPRARLLGRVVRLPGAQSAGTVADPRRCCSTGTAGCRRLGARPVPPAIEARCSRGRSGSDGREESQQLHLNPRSGRWLPDPSRGNTTSASRSPSTCGSTTRSPATSSSSVSAAPRCWSRSPGSSRASPRTTAPGRAT